MPITTLPNPGMDFTPLTPLTAEEMDDIVENIEAINNATIQTGSIADGAITKAKLGADAMSNQNYSTTEIDTGTTWIDGKKIYKKTFDCGAEPANYQSTETYFDIPNFGNVVKIEGIMTDGYDDFYPIPFNYPNSSSNRLFYSVSVKKYVSSSETRRAIEIRRGTIAGTYDITSLDITKIYVTLFYTKTS